MNTDPKTRAVWQRVQGTAPAPALHRLPELITEQRLSAAAYLSLSRCFGGRESAMLRKMAEEAQTHIACLRGIHRMATGEGCRVQTVPTPQEAPHIALRRCYGREMRCLAAYEAQSGDEEYGAVFSQLACQAREHCKNILFLTGRTDPGDR